jgi:hypothetical protein
VERDGRAWRGNPGEGRTTSNVDGSFSIENLPKGRNTTSSRRGPAEVRELDEINERMRTGRERTKYILL